MRYDRPIQTGDTSYVYYRWLPDGIVEHIVRPGIYALANITTRVHVLYPGYIIRWLEQQPDGIIVSYTLGRGVGMFAETNENVGAKMFMELDENIAESLSVQ